MAAIPEKDMTIIAALDSFCLGIFYVFTAAFIKTSFISTIYRTFGSHFAKGCLWILIVMLFGVAIACTIVNLAQCRPLAAAWDFSYSRDNCMNPDIYQHYLYGIISAYVMPKIHCR
jgi:hypothetical protein